MLLLNESLQFLLVLIHICLGPFSWLLSFLTSSSNLIFYSFLATDSYSYILDISLTNNSIFSLFHFKHLALQQPHLIFPSCSKTPELQILNLPKPLVDQSYRISLFLISKISSFLHLSSLFSIVYHCNHPFASTHNTLLFLFLLYSTWRIKLNWNIFQFL